MDGADTDRDGLGPDQAPGPSFGAREGGGPEVETRPTGGPQNSRGQF